jgi:hypothetical protein
MWLLLMLLPWKTSYAVCDSFPLVWKILNFYTKMNLSFKFKCILWEHKWIIIIIIINIFLYKFLCQAKVCF